jgi:hypothetical protein
MSRTTAVLALGLSVLACGGHSESLASDGPDAGITKVTGTIGGVGFPGGAYAIAIPDNENATASPGNEYTQLALAIAGKPLACTTSSLPNSVFIGIQIILPGAAPVGPGTYEIEANPESSNDNVAALVTTDSNCAEAAPANCVGGSVTITASTATSISGSFTLAFDSGEAITGTFGAEVCSAIPSSVNGSPC